MVDGFNPNFTSINIGGGNRTPGVATNVAETKDGSEPNTETPSDSSQISGENPDGSFPRAPNASEMNKFAANGRNIGQQEAAAAPQSEPTEQQNTFTLNDENVTPAIKRAYGYKLEDGENGSKLSFDPNGRFTILEAKSFEANGTEKTSGSSNLAGRTFSGSKLAFKSDGNVADIALSEPERNIGHNLKIRVNNKDGSYQEMTLKKEGIR